MKIFIIRSAITIAALLVGLLIVTGWFNYPSVDATIYLVDYCDLIKHSKQFDGKLVRVKGLYHQGVERVDLRGIGCSDSIRVEYILDDNARKIIEQIGAVKFPERAKVDVIGRFSSEVTDPDPPNDGNYFHPRIKLLVIEELIGIETINLQ